MKTIFNESKKGNQNINKYGRILNFTYVSLETISVTVTKTITYVQKILRPIYDTKEIIKFFSLPKFITQK